PSLHGRADAAVARQERQGDLEQADRVSDDRRPHVRDANRDGRRRGRHQGADDDGCGLGGTGPQRGRAPDDDAVRREGGGAARRGSLPEVDGLAPPPLRLSAPGVCPVRTGRHNDFMASYSVNPAGVAKARALIEARQYVLESTWGDVQPTAEAENRFLEGHSWEDYAARHLRLTSG